METTRHTRLEKYLSENRDRIIGFIFDKTGDPDLAEDLLQESLLKALRAADSLKDEEKLISWFYRIIRNAIIDEYRRQGKEEKLMDTSLLENQEDPGPEAEQSLCRCFLGVIPTMNPQYARIIESLELGGEDPVEVAAELGITRSNLKVKRHRARRQLRERLEQTCRTCARHGCVDCTCRSQLV